MSTPFDSQPVDFQSLAEHYPHLKPYVVANQNGIALIDFKNPRALRELSYAILATYFGLKVEFPLDSLCPPIPNRLDYIVFLEGLVTRKNAHGLDIGTGASCIYPLLGCTRNPTWTFTAIESNDRNVEYARDNIHRNTLSDRITLLHTDTIPNTHFDFVMCNPPFYENQEEVYVRQAMKRLPPSGICMGRPHEMVVGGGEVAFALNMIQVSFERRESAWWSCLIGKKEDLVPLLDALQAKEAVVQQHIITRGRTVRWILAWCWKH